MIKYYFEYTNVVGDFFRVEILVEGYSGESNEIQGTATLELGSNDSVLNPFRGMALKLDLEANVNLNFTDLYTENETDVRVNFYRNNQLLYKGFVKPDGIYADFVDDNWIITLDSIDGLGILENLRFVKDDGTFYTGFMTELDIIRACLYRSTMRLPINTRMLIYHEDVNSSQNVLERTKLNTERFVKDVESSEVEIMDCAEVLKSILDKYNAVVQQYNGEWFIYRPIDTFAFLPNLRRDGKVNFFRYGNPFVSDTNFTGISVIPTVYKLGSNIDGFYPHHVNENQRIEIEGAVSAFRVKYKYGFVRSLLTNKQFENLYSPNNGWIVNSEIYFTQIDGRWLRWDVPEIQSIPANFQFNGSYEVRSGNSINVQETDIVNLDIDYEHDRSSLIYGMFIQVRLGITVRLGGIPVRTVKYATQNGWSDNPSMINILSNIGHSHERNLIEAGYIGNNIVKLDRYLLSINFEIPEDGELSVLIFAPGVSEVTRPVFVTDYAVIRSLDVYPNVSASQYDGESHTALRKPANSSNVEDSIEVFNGDMDSDIYVGTMKKLNGQNTKNWHRQGKAEEKELLEIMVEDRIRLQSKPQKVFSGDVFGYIPSLSFITINNLDGLFYPISYSYDTINNICKFELNEIFGNELENEIDYTKIYDRGNVIKPTIEG